MNKPKNVEEFVKEQKQAATIRVKTLVIALIWVATVVAGVGFGIYIRSNFEAEVASRVDYRLEQRELVKADQ